MVSEKDVHVFKKGSFSSKLKKILFVFDLYGMSRMPRLSEKYSFGETPSWRQNIAERDYN